MSEPMLISPLLDHFAIGDAISEHHGVRCYPAMRNFSDDKYIVKVISIPASQVQLEALLLTGAYRDQNSALAYFKELADATVEEAELLQKLSRLEGFISYEGWQVVPMRGGVGYDVYLLGRYRRSLESYLRRNPMTQLAAVNLGLDICAALAVCRRAGYLYADLKPSNIYLSGDQSFQIGDLGLMSLTSLKYASLPEKFRSSYTPPETPDAYSSVSDTADIYSLGLILYQVYNDGRLPFGDCAPSEPLPPPVYADYEMAEIILKACSPDPAQRWQDPVEMGQALVNYMQRNGANDTSIIPVPTEPAPAEAEVSEEEAPEEELPAEEAPAQEPEAIPAGEPEPAEDTDVEPPSFMIMEEALPEPSPAEDEPDSLPEEPETEVDEISFISDMLSDETVPTDETSADLDEAALTEEMTEILAQADDLIAHETPEGVVAPEPIEIPMPEPILPEPEPQEDGTEDEPEASEVQEAEEVVPEVEPAEEAPKKKKTGRVLLILFIILCLLSGLACGGYYYYENYYLQSISDLQLEGTGDTLTALLSTDIPDGALTVTCTDTYGISSTVPVTGGVAEFTGLKPATTYNLAVNIDGFHALRGKTTATYTTASQTNIVSFNAITGAADGSVILSFTPDGPEPEEWTVTYRAEGEEMNSVTFTGHNVTVSDLTVGKEYTFVLSAGENMYLTGTDTINFTASQVIYAQNLRFEALKDHVLTLAWDAPEGVTGQVWSLTQFNQAGEILSMQTTEDTTADLTLEDLSQGYTFELLAEGMTQSTKISISANPVIITGVSTDDSNPPKLYLSWSYEGGEPEGGWIVTVRAGGEEPLAVLTCEDSTAELDTLIPGANYTLEFQAADSTTVFNGSFSFHVPAAEPFDDHWITGDNVDLAVCLTPELEEWSHEDLTDASFPETFQAGAKTSLSMTLNRSYSSVKDQTLVVLVIRDASGVPVIADSYSLKWSDIFYRQNGGRYGELNIPTMPAAAGTYAVELYFNNAYVGSTEFTVS